MDRMGNFSSLLDSNADCRETCIISELLRVHKIPLKLLERLTGKLLWVTSAWHQLRPLLNPFYYTLSSPSPTLISLSLTEWPQLLQSLDEAGVITAPMSHPSLQVGVRVFRVGNTNVSIIFAATASDVFSQSPHLGEYF